MTRLRFPNTAKCVVVIGMPRRLERVHLGVKLICVVDMIARYTTWIFRGLRFKFETTEEISKNGTLGCLFCF